MENQALKIKTFSQDRVGEVLQKLFESEIDVSLQGVGGLRFDWSVGDQKQPDKVRSVSPTNNDLATTVSWIANIAAQYYPGSDFAKWYNTLPADPLPGKPGWEFRNYRGNY